MPSKSFRGRPRKLGFPPRASTYRTDAYSYLCKHDLATMADAAGISIVADEENQNIELHRLNQALNDFVLSESNTRSTSAEKRDWCETLATTCRNLLEGLGLDDDGLRPKQTPEGWSRHQDARMHLAEGFSPVFDDPTWRNPARDSLLDALLRLAQFGVGAGTAPEFARLEAFDFAMERIGGSLGALAIIADRAALRFGNQTRRGGKEFDHARHQLFFELGRSFERMFGRPVSVWSDEAGSPLGPAFSWHRSLLEIVAGRVRETGERDGVDSDPRSIEQKNPPSLALVELASRAAGIGGERGQARYHALAHWMRDAVRDRNSISTANRR